MLRRLGLSSCFALAAASAGAVLWASEDAGPLVSSPPRVDFHSSATLPNEEVELPNFLLREGSRLKDALGRFRQDGDQLTFIDNDAREIGGLPNLNLERIARTLQSVEEPESVVWSVSGTITEFAGRNHVLISRAVYKSSSLPPAPETISPTPAPAR
jgi:hypothetical protein